MNAKTIFRAFAVALLVFSASAAWSADFGLNLSNTSEYSRQEDWSFSQNNQALAWFSVPVSPNAFLYVSAYYEFSGDWTKDESEITPWAFDLDRTELEGSVSGVFGPQTVLRYNVGRISLSDFSSYVVSDLSDGARLELSVGNISVYAAGGYRGLFDKEDARSFLDADDYENFADEDIYFAPRRAFAAAGVRFIEFVKDTDFGLEGYGQFDLEEKGTTTNTQYVEPFADGRIGRPFRWRLWNVTEFGYDEESFVAMAAGGSFRYSNPEARNFRITASAAWASGDAGPFRPFTGIRSKQAATIGSYSFSDLVNASVELSVTVVRGVTLSASGAALFRASDVAPAGGDPDSDAYYLGFEPSGRITFRPVTDFTLSLSGGAFFPNADLYVVDDPLYKAILSATFSL